MVDTSCDKCDHIVTVAQKVSCFSWRHKTILVAARPETWQFWSRRELHFSLLDERLSILVATCCYEAPQDLLNSGRQTRQISSRREMSNISWREMRRGKRAERAMCINKNSPQCLDNNTCLQNSHCYCASFEYKLKYKYITIQTFDAQWIHRKVDCRECFCGDFDAKIYYRVPIVFKKT